MPGEHVTADDVTNVLATVTGIPLARLQQSERHKLLELEAVLHRRVVGQELAVEAVSNAVSHPEL